MSQYLLPYIDPDIVTGSQLAQWLNQWAPAIQTAQTGSSRPSSVTAGFLWLEQASPTVWNYKLFDGADDIILLTVNPTTNTVSFPGMGGTLGTAAAADIITSPTDSTAGRVITVGGGGLLGNAPFAADASNIPSSRFSSVTAGTANIPVAQTGTLLTIIDGNNGAQIYQSATTGSMYRRSRFGSSWGAWSEVWTAANLVKTTSSIDTTSGRMLQVGDFGLGNVGSAPALTNIDDTTTPSGFFRVVTGTGTRPVGSSANAFIHVERYSSTVVKQLWTDVIGGSPSSDVRSWWRTSYGTGAWNTWVEVWSDNHNISSTPSFINVKDKYTNKGSVTGTVTIDPTVDGGDVEFTMTGNTAVTFTTSGIASNESAVCTVQVNGSFAVTWPAGIFWPTGGVPAYTSPSIYTFQMRNKAGTMQIFGFQSGAGMVAV